MGLLFSAIETPYLLHGGCDAAAGSVRRGGAVSWGKLRKKNGVEIDGGLTKASVDDCVNVVARILLEVQQNNRYTRYKL